MSSQPDSPHPVGTASPQPRESDGHVDGKQSDSAGRSPPPQEDSEAEQAAASTSAAGSSASPPPTATATNGDWQAIWSPDYNAYYFHNTKSGETTWTNPLQPAPAEEASVDPTATSMPPTPSASMSAMYDLQAAAVAQGIDPSLAHLDPSLAAGPSNPAFTYTAKFNARTGAFTKPDGRDPSHLSEYERAKRMSEFYFDVNAWEREVESRKLEEAQEEESKKRKRPTKKDLERFKEQKRLKKIAKTAWLRT
ncbi:uncharacterized protein FIBRA_07869 [Fibroporia radiculosa]|uniref:WW domain-containing protein n=1 Tax=Fibroporia radiculosa TaxID=599839 RepID=J4GVS0_9APHY|nr:uncharacterized protein FIBRA_07869 [Fibroporia radiculosa]CCM05640.1 predicted protein [Fibroporia radiculosa]